jgi:glucosamine-6-phosphate deaminase
MEIMVYDSVPAMAAAAAEQAATLLKDAIAARGRAVFIAATGVSQFVFLENLTADPDIDWSKTVMFHLDEYVGLDDAHPASFVRYLRERVVEKVHPGTVHFIDGSADPAKECARLNALIRARRVDAAFVGIGENGHLAFNDPPADFDTNEPYIVVVLDEACRQQQLGEGWFPTLEDVPTRAISMSIRQILNTKAVVCTVPDERKAQAVKDCLAGDEVSPKHPASVLKTHARCTVFLDQAAASLLPEGSEK